MLNNIDNLLYESQFMEVLYFPKNEILYNKWKVSNILQKDLYNEMLQWQKFFNAKYTKKIVTNNLIKQTLDKDAIDWMSKFLKGIFTGKEIYWDLILPPQDYLLQKTYQRMMSLFENNVHWRFIDDFNESDYL